ncbi:hypothetical protein [Nocardia sp. X0981]
MVISKALVQLGARLSATARNIASGWRSHSPNHEGKLAAAMTPYQQAAARGEATISSAAPPTAGGRASVPAGAARPDPAHSAGRVGDTALRDGPRVNRTADQVTVCNDPVDVATGEFVLAGIDLRLPGCGHGTEVRL